MTTVEEVSGSARRARRRADQGDAGGGRRGPHGHRARPRRPPPERDQAPKRARRRLPACARRGDRRALGPPGFIGPVGTDLPVLKDAAISGRGLRLWRQQARHAPDRRRARARLPVRGDGHAVGRGGRPRARRPSDRDRAGDRGRPDLQAGHPLFGAARRQLSGRARHRAADRDGQLRDRPGADGRGGDRAARRRARGSCGRARSRPWDVHLVGLGKAGDEVDGGGGRASTRSSRARARGRLRRSRGGAGREAHRRRAARVPAAARGGQAGAGRGVVEAQARRSGADERLAVAEAASRAVELLDGME